MSKRDTTAAIVDGLLKVAIGGVVISSALVLPNLLVALDKPTAEFLKKMDKKAQERELRRVLRYMKRKQLIKSQKYEHGIVITKKGRQRLKKSDFINLAINKPPKWDEKWRLVIFDIPEQHKAGRNALASKLYQLGFKPLQRSVWIHPFPCHQEIEAVALHYKLTNYVTYIETNYIDKPNVLKKRFQHLLNM